MFKVIKYAEEKGKESVAKNLLSHGMDDEFVMEATGLDMSLLERIKKSLTLPTK